VRLFLTGKISYNSDAAPYSMKYLIIVTQFLTVKLSYNIDAVTNSKSIL